MAAIQTAMGGDPAMEAPLLDTTNAPGSEEYPGVAVDGTEGRAGALFPRFIFFTREKTTLNW